MKLLLLRLQLGRNFFGWLLCSYEMNWMELIRSRMELVQWKIFDSGFLPVNVFWCPVTIVRWWWRTANVFLKRPSRYLDEIYVEQREKNGFENYCNSENSKSVQKEVTAISWHNLSQISQKNKVDSFSNCWNLTVVNVENLLCYL